MSVHQINSNLCLYVTASNDIADMRCFLLSANHNIEKGEFTFYDTNQKYPRKRKPTYLIILCHCAFNQIFYHS